MMIALGGSMHISLRLTWPDTIDRGEMVDSQVILDKRSNRDACT